MSIEHHTTDEYIYIKYMTDVLTQTESHLAYFQATEYLRRHQWSIEIVDLSDVNIILASNEEIRVMAEASVVLFSQYSPLHLIHVSGNPAHVEKIELFNSVLKDVGVDTVYHAPDLDSAKSLAHELSNK